MSRHAAWLAAWAVLCILPLGVVAMPAEAIVSRVVATTIAPALRLVLFVVLIALVVQEDPVVGSTAFWMTRPIGGRALMASKFLFVGTLLVLPAVVIDVALVASTGVGMPYVALAIPEIILEWIVWAACVLALATLTSTLPGLISATFKVILLTISVHWLVQIAQSVACGTTTRDAFLPALTFFFSPDGNAKSEAASFLASRTLITLVLLAGAALSVAAMQYGTRQVRRAWATLAVGMLCVLGVRAAWRWDFFSPSRSEPRQNEGIAASIHVSIDPHGRLESQAIQRGGSTTDVKIVHSHVVVEGAASPVAAEVEHISGWLTFDDGSRLSVQATGGGGLISRWNAVAVEELLGGAHFVNLEQEKALMTPVLSVPTTDYERHADTPGHLKGTASLALRVYHVAAELPLRPNAAYDHGGGHAVISTVQNAGGDCTVSINETEVSLLLAPNASANRRVLFMRFNPDVLYVLRNRQRGQAFWPTQGMLFGFGWTLQTGIDESVMIQQYRSSIASGPPLPHIDAAWVAGADLVRIEGETVASITKPVEVERFVIGREAAGQ